MENFKEPITTLEPNSVYSARTLSKVLHVSIRTIYYMVQKREIPFVRITPESSIRFPGWQIRKWLDEKAKAGEET